MPSSWVEAVMVALPKVPDAILPSDFRGITLLSHVSKIMLRIINVRACGVPIGRTVWFSSTATVMAVAALKNVAQTAIQSGQSLYVGFLDLVKAYDSVYRTALFDILRQYGFGDHTLRLLRNYYLDQNFVRVNGKLGAPFQSGRGVRQGCLLSPLLFDIVLDWVFRRAKDQLTPICHGTISLWGLAYADDIALVAYTPDVLQRNLNVLQEHLQKVGLKISPAKTKAMCVSPALHVVGDLVQGASSRNQKYASRVAGAGDAVRGTYSFENGQKYILWPPDCSAMICPENKCNFVAAQVHNLHNHLLRKQAEHQCSLSGSSW